MKTLKWHNISRVFRWEFTKNLKSAVFLVTTLMIPCIMLLAAGISYFASTSAAKEEQQVAVIDETGEIFPYLESYLTGSPVKVTLQNRTGLKSLYRQVESGELNGYLNLNAENLQDGMINYYVRDA
ncbi:MAG: ABC transporter permease, partial [Firmicutes bacterium]|nr:ABC transporter permease [Bacillota bacterium]